MNRVVLWADNTRAGPKRTYCRKRFPSIVFLAFLGIICVCLPQQDWCFLDFFFLRFLQEFHVGSVIFPHAFVLDRGDWSCSDAHLHLTHTYPTYYPSLLYPSILYLTLPYHLALPFTTSFIRYSVFLFGRIAHLHSEALCEHYSPKSSPLV